jgi:hypothetical protein
MTASDTPTIRSLAEAEARWPNPPPPEVVQTLQNLLQVYALLADEGREAELARLFTDDAEWDGEELGYGEASGPEAIARTVLGHFDPNRPMMHLPGPGLFTAVSSDEVHAISWCTATRWADGRTSPVIYFHYEDVLRRGEDDRWRFARRALRFRFRDR